MNLAPSAPNPLYRSEEDAAALSAARRDATRVIRAAGAGGSLLASLRAAASVLSAYGGRARFLVVVADLSPTRAWRDLIADDPGHLDADDRVGGTLDNIPAKLAHEARLADLAGVPTQLVALGAAPSAQVNLWAMILKASGAKLLGAGPLGIIAGQQ